MLLFLLFGAFSLVAAVTGQDGRILSSTGFFLSGKVVLSTDGNTLAVGGMNSSTFSGLAQVYIRSGGAWNLQE